MHGDFFILFQSTREEGWCRRIPHLGRRQRRDGLCFSLNVNEQSDRGFCASVADHVCTSLSEVVLEGRWTLFRFGREACSQLPSNVAFARRARSAEGRSVSCWDFHGDAHVSPFNVPRAGAQILKQLVEQRQTAQYATSPQIMKGLAKQHFRRHWQSLAGTY